MLVVAGNGSGAISDDDLACIAGRISQTHRTNHIIHLLSCFWPREAEGTGVDGVEDPMERSDFTLGDVALSVSLPSTEPTSLSPLLRARRPFHGTERSFRISVLDQRRWWGDGERQLHLIACERRARAPCGETQTRPTVLPLKTVENTDDKRKSILSRIHITILQC